MQTGVAARYKWRVTCSISSFTLTLPCILFTRDRDYLKCLACAMLVPYPSSCKHSPLMIWQICLYSFLPRPVHVSPCHHLFAQFPYAPWYGQWVCTRFIYCKIYGISHGSDIRQSVTVRSGVDSLPSLISESYWILCSSEEQKNHYRAT